MVFSAIRVGLLALLWAPLASAGEARISASASLDPSTLAVGEEGVLQLEINVPEGWHLWSLDPGEGPLALQLTLGEGAEPVGPWTGDAPHAVFDRGFNRELFQYGSGAVQLARKIRAQAPVGSRELILKIRGQICTESQCIEQRETLKLALEVAAQPTGAAAVQLTGTSLTERSSKNTVTAQAKSSELDDLKKEGIWAFMLISFLFGLGALATPCVFPAIPLTISFFSKYSGESWGRGARLAAVYALTMVGTFTAAGVAISLLFGASGMNAFAAHPIFNLFLGGTLIFFALNLLGLFEIKPPMWMLNFSNNLEQKLGRGAQRSQGGVGDYLVVAVAAITATTVFFTCTVGFVGPILVQAASGEWFWPALAMLAFSSAFSLPFFLLAMFPQGAKRLRGKSGSWLGATRVTLGFLELAAASKFLSNADLVWQLGFLTRDLVLALWVPLFLMCGLYLLGKLKIGHESVESPGGGVSVVQMLSSTAMLGVALFLAVRLLNGQPFGNWVDGWLPPLQYPGQAHAQVAGKGPQLQWKLDLTEARAEARKTGQLVFLNYTGYTCTNCRYMEGAVFPRPEIAGLLGEMVLAELYTDNGSPENEAYRQDQIDRFGTAALPFYVVERADGTVIASFPSSTNNPEEFRQFLADAIQKAKSAAPAPVALVKHTTRLSDGQPAQAVVAGKWNLVNFWATWCAPCRQELESFMAKMGQDFVAQGGHFVTLALEEDDTVLEAHQFMQKIGVPAQAALRLPGEPPPDATAPAIGFSGAAVPYTVLISPTGEVVWKHAEAITAAELKAILVQHTGYAALQ